MADTEQKIGIFLNNGCGTQFTEEDARQMADRVYFTGLVPKENIIYQKELGSSGLAQITKEIFKYKFNRLVLAGYSPTIHDHEMAHISAETGIPMSHIRGVPLRSSSRNGSGVVGEASEAVIQALNGLTAVPDIETQTVDMLQDIVVIGCDAAAAEAANGCSALGYHVTVAATPSGTDAGDFTSRLADGIVYRGGSVPVRLDGTVGNYQLVLRSVSGTGSESIQAGAVILCGDDGTLSPFPGDAAALISRPEVTGLDTLVETVRSAPVRQEVRSIGILLDWYRDETKAGTAAALKAAAEIQKEGRFQVHLFCRDARVAGYGLEELYDDVREMGANIVKYEDLTVTAGDEGIVLDLFDSVLRGRAEFICDTLGISSDGLGMHIQSEILDNLAVFPDHGGYVQENNIHLFPVETNRPGVFTAGAVKGSPYMEEAVQQARSAAMAAHRLLSPGKLDVECSQVQIDPDKCVLCLTCIRCCPYKALYVDNEVGAAASSPEVCQKCGICAGECPMKAITLPAYSDMSIMNQL